MAAVAVLPVANTGATTRNDQLATLKQHGGRRRRPSGLWSICVSGDRCGDAVGFSLSTRRQCNGRRQAGADVSEFESYMPSHAVGLSASLLVSAGGVFRPAMPDRW